MRLKISGLKLANRNQKTSFWNLGLFGKLQRFCKKAVATGRIDQPARPNRVFSLLVVAYRDPVEPGAATIQIDSDNRARDHRHAVVEVSATYLAVKGESVDLEGKQRRDGRRLINDVRAIRGLIDCGLVIIGEAVLGKMVFDQITAEP